jgi:L-gulonolactone oxidase
MSEARFFDTATLRSWGRILRPRHMAGRPAWRDEAVGFVQEGARQPNGVLALGLGRSYGDSGLNPEGAAILTTSLDRLMAFDPATGVLRAEAGISLAALLAFLIPRGFFLPVTPGTRYVTLGGAVANDVHGKNHHEAGTFGCWVRALGLVRSDGAARVLRADDTDGLFAATIGGLGLTGLITWVEFEALPTRSSQMDVETIPYETLPEFFALAQESDAAWQYTVSWIDCFAKGGIGRGLFSRARHASSGTLALAQPEKQFAVPAEAPDFVLGNPVMRAFNALYYAEGKRKAASLPGARRESYLPFFYPLDAIQRWNLLYGKRGMYQYQSVIPPASAATATTEMLHQIAAAGEGSFLAVLKTFGPRASPGLLSFPREGTTLALDFPNRGASTLALLARLDDVVREAGGRLYPAKDGRIPPDMFRRGYPDLNTFAAHIDPHFSSAFWRRMQT